MYRYSKIPDIEFYSNRVNNDYDLYFVMNVSTEQTTEKNFEALRRKASSVEKRLIKKLKQLKLKGVGVTSPVYSEMENGGYYPPHMVVARRIFVGPPASKDEDTYELLDKVLYDIGFEEESFSFGRYQTASELRRIAALLGGDDFEVVGMPKTFWMVTKPTDVSLLEDILVELDYSGFARQIRGGLDPDKIHGIYKSEKDALKVAEDLLGD